MENNITNQRLTNISTLANLFAVNCRKLDNMLSTRAIQMKQQSDLKDIEKLKEKIRVEVRRWKYREEMVSALNPGMNIGGPGKKLSSFIAWPRADSCLEQTTSVRGLQNQQTFGNVMICVGEKGIPDCVEVVSISKLAREQTRREPEIVNALRRQGKALFSEYEFHNLTDKISHGIAQGKFFLPLCLDQLPLVPRPASVGVQKLFIVRQIRR